MLGRLLDWAEERGTSAGGEAKYHRKEGRKEENGYDGGGMDGCYLASPLDAW